MKALNKEVDDDYISTKFNLNKLIGCTIKDVMFSGEEIVILTTSDKVYEIHNEHGVEEDKIGHHYAKQ